MGQTRSKDRLLAPEFVKKYLEIAKCMKPALTEEACEMIGEEYAKLRSQDFENSDVARTQPVTARALETLIRLSTAHAKSRLSKVKLIIQIIVPWIVIKSPPPLHCTWANITMSPFTIF
jgi:DNA replicative helicase MCM subunit Mcm2 (Cdc46/Mcm family)